MCKLSRANTVAMVVSHYVILVLTATSVGQTLYMHH